MTTLRTHTRYFTFCYPNSPVLVEHIHNFIPLAHSAKLWFSSLRISNQRNLQQSENEDTKLLDYELPYPRISIWDGDLNVRIRQQKLLRHFRRRVWWQNTEENIVASTITIRVSESVQRISTCASWRWTTCTEIILALKTIWKQEFRTPRLLSHQQNFGAQLTCLLRMARVCKPKKIISSTIPKYSE